MTPGDRWHAFMQLSTSITLYRDTLGDMPTFLNHYRPNPLFSEMKGIKDGPVSFSGYGRLSRLACKRHRPRRLNAHHHLNLHHGYAASRTHRKAHEEWVMEYIDKGKFLFASPKKDKPGRVIVAKSIDEELLSVTLSEASYLQQAWSRFRSSP